MNYISLGYFCSVAMELEKLGLRRESAPFDWTISDFSGVIRAIQNHFEDYLAYDLLYQNKQSRSYYQNSLYGVQFFHDFDAYRPLEAQLAAVQEKYERRIKRFYQRITEPTLFIRYISNEDSEDRPAELLWIENNYDEIVTTLKSFHKDNEIIFIANAGVESSSLRIYHVEKDEGDLVCRTPIVSQPELLKMLSVAEVPNKEQNIKRYLRKEKEKQKISRKIKVKVESLSNRLFRREYHHFREY